MAWFKTAIVKKGLITQSDKIKNKKVEQNPLKKTDSSHSVV